MKIKFSNLFVCVGVCAYRHWLIAHIHELISKSAYIHHTSYNDKDKTSRHHTMTKRDLSTLPDSRPHFFPKYKGDG